MTKRISLSDEAFDEALRRASKFADPNVGLVIRCSRSGVDLVCDSLKKPAWQEIEPNGWQALVMPIKLLGASEQSIFQVRSLQVCLFSHRPVQGNFDVSLVAGEFHVQAC